MFYKPKFNIKSLLDAGVHFGHKKNHWNPEMAKYIYGVRKRFHIIDLNQTSYHLYYALKVAYAISSNNGKVLFVNIKKQSSDIIKNAALRCGQYYINHRWLGGMLTNWNTISISINSLKKYNDMINNKKLLYTKKEFLNLNIKRKKLSTIIGGISNLNRLPDLLFVIDVKTHAIAINEARKMNIPVIGIVDTNSSPKNVDFVIPGNDDSRKSASLYSNLIADSIIGGNKQYMSRNEQ